jgi:1,4-dihydroxy-2-naphthoate octaprenyltransferase
VTLKQFIGVVELRTKVVSVSTFVAALLYAAWRTGSLRPIESVVCFFAVLLVDMGTTAFNSYFDFQRGVDAEATNREADKVLLHEDVGAGSALIVALSCFAAAGSLGIVLAFLTGFWVIVVGAACLAAGFLYSGGPRPISATPFGELVAGGFLGTALFLIVVRVVSGLTDCNVVAASLPSAAIIASILAANNRCDIEGDKAAGRKTLPIVLGPRWGEAAIYLGGILAFGLPALFALVGGYPAWSALGSGAAAVLAFVEYRKMALRGYSHATKGATMASILRIFIFWSLGMTSGLAAGLALG